MPKVPAYIIGAILGYLIYRGLLWLWSFVNLSEFDRLTREKIEKAEKRKFSDGEWKRMCRS